MRLQINSICTDGGTQLRAADSKTTVADYADAIRGGAAFPPIVVFFDGDKYWLADGFHRLDAHREAGQQEIEADVRTGSKRDAILFAAGANAEHGLRRTTEDKRRAVLALLRDPEWRRWSDRSIAVNVKVDHKTVAKYRRELYGEIPTEPVNGEIPTERRFVTGHGTEAARKTASHDAPRGSIMGSFLSKVPIDDLVAECRRRGKEVIDA
jgi:uncharacterized ParB-like nuclease family protein